jgi:hypothetical protein
MNFYFLVSFKFYLSLSTLYSFSCFLKHFSKWILSEYLLKHILLQMLQITLLESSWTLSLWNLAAYLSLKSFPHIWQGKVFVFRWILPKCCFIPLKELKVILHCKQIYDTPSLIFSYLALGFPTVRWWIKSLCKLNERWQCPHTNCFSDNLFSKSTGMTGFGNSLIYSFGKAWEFCMCIIGII